MVLSAFVYSIAICYVRLNFFFTRIFIFYVCCCFCFLLELVLFLQLLSLLLTLLLLFFVIVNSYCYFINVLVSVIACDLIYCDWFWIFWFFVLLLWLKCKYIMWPIILFVVDLFFRNKKILLVLGGPEFEFTWRHKCCWSLRSERVHCFCLIIY